MPWVRLAIQLSSLAALSGILPCMREPKGVAIMTLIQFPQARIVREAPQTVDANAADWLRLFCAPIPWYFDWLKKHYGDLPPTYPRRR